MEAWESQPHRKQAASPRELQRHGADPQQAPPGDVPRETGPPRPWRHHHSSSQRLGSMQTPTKGGRQVSHTCPNTCTPCPTEADKPLSSEVRHELPSDPGLHTPGRMENRCPNIYLCIDVHSRMVLKSRKVETTPCPSRDDRHRTWSIHTVDCDTAVQRNKF